MIPALPEIQAIRIAAGGECLARIESLSVLRAPVPLDIPSGALRASARANAAGAAQQLVETGWTNAP
jgi:hypothetical protein